MTKKLLASVMAFALCQFMLATDMIVKQKNGEIKKFNVEDVEEVIFNENSNIPNDSTVVDASESPLNFSIKPDSTVEVTGVNKDSESIEIPSKVKIDGKVYTVNSIKYSAFSWKRSLTTLEIPSSITSIAESSVFSGSSKLKSINVASDNPNYSSVDGVLYNKDKTKIICVPGGIRGDFTIPSSVNCIGYSAFENDSLTSVKIPSSVTKIGIYAFCGCQIMKSIDIPASVTEIEDGAFARCSNMTNINIASDNPNFITVDGVLYNKDTTELISVPAGIEGKFVVPSTVKSIRGWSFWGSGFDLINVPSSVTNIGDGAFWNCMNIVIDNSSKNVTTGEYTFTNCFSVRFTKNTPVVAGNPDLSVVMDTSDIRAVIFKTLSDSTAEVSHYRGAIDSFYIPAKIRIDGKIYTVTEIANGAFYIVGGGSLEGIKLPSTITSIGEEAFEWCEMESIEIPSSVTSIGEKAFSYCQNLRSVKIPSNVTSIGNGAFHCCWYLDIVIDNSKDNVKVGEDVFGGCKSVTWLKE